MQDLLKRAAEKVAERTLAMTGQTRDDYELTPLDTGVSAPMICSGTEVEYLELARYCSSVTNAALVHVLHGGQVDSAVMGVATESLMVGYHAGVEASKPTDVESDVLREALEDYRAKVLQDDAHQGLVAVADSMLERLR